MYILPLSSIQPVEALADKQQQTGMQTDLSGVPFAQTLRDAVTNLQESQAIAAQDSYDLAVGNPVELSTMMIHSAMQATAVETVVQLTSRAVSSYKEIMQMQV